MRDKVIRNMLRPILVNFDINIISTCTFIFCILFINSPVFAKEIIGKVEKVGIGKTGFILRAKIDTGATNSSLNATNYHLSLKGNQKWIRFDVTNREGKTITLKKPIKRFVKIKRKETTTQQRPAILLDICIGRIVKQVEVNLVNRSNFNYQMLIGRSFLSGNYIVDVDKTFTHKPDC